MNNTNKSMHIGKGSYGSVVVSGKSKHHAVKLFNSKDFKFYIRELWFLSLVKDVPNFCQLVSYELDKLEFTMIRYNTNLHTLMSDLKYEKRVDITDAIVAQMNDAVSYLHARGVAHNDISESNIFCNYDYQKGEIQCFLGDFSVTSVNDDYKSHDKKKYLYYDMDPEATNMESDVWSLGVTIFFFLTKCIQWEDVMFILNSFDYIDYKYLYPDYKINTYTYDVLCKFLRFKGSERPRVDILNDINKKFIKLKHKNRKGTVRRDAIKFMKYVTMDRCLIESPDNTKFVDYFSPIDITDFVKRNFK